MTTKKKAPAKKRAKTSAKPRTKRAAAKAPAKTPAESAHGPKPGEVIERTYKGEKHVVQATAEGYLYRGKAYRSLTALAKEITGYPAISGPAFFGLWRAKAPAKDGAKGGAK